MDKYIRHIINAILLAGIIILFIGAYYSIFKTGIPYQDPPLELQIQYAVNMGIGDILTRDGLLISLCGGIARLFFTLLTLLMKKSGRKK